MVGDVAHFAPSDAPPLGQNTETRVSFASQLAALSACTILRSTAAAARLYRLCHPCSPAPFGPGAPWRLPADLARRPAPGRRPRPGCLARPGDRPDPGRPVRLSAPDPGRRRQATSAMATIMYGRNSHDAPRQRMNWSPAATSASSGTRPRNHREFRPIDDAGSAVGTFEARNELFRAAGFCPRHDLDHLSFVVVGRKSLGSVIGLHRGASDQRRHRPAGFRPARPHSRHPYAAAPP